MNGNRTLAIVTVIYCATIAAGWLITTFHMGVMAPYPTTYLKLAGVLLTAQYGDHFMKTGSAATIAEKVLTKVSKKGGANGTTNT
jgi:hypothetical protein